MESYNQYRINIKRKSLKARRVLGMQTGMLEEIIPLFSGLSPIIKCLSRNVVNSIRNQRLQELTFLFLSHFIIILLSESS